MEAEHGWIACSRPAPLAHSWVTHPFCSLGSLGGYPALSGGALR